MAQRNPVVIASLLTTAAIIFGTSKTAKAAESGERPNILFLTSEDNSHHWIGCYGNQQASTPNIDQLATEGVRYRFAYANAPVCAVARFTMITGRYACSMGAQNMRSRYPIPARFKTYVSYLREAGYYCVNRSKTDYNFKTDDCSHWDESSGRAHWKNRPDGKPFFAVFNIGTSHESSLFQQKIAASKSSGAIPQQPRLDPASIQLPPYLPDTPEIRSDWATYTDIITAMDKQVGNLLTELEDAGLRDNTIVIYFADHGGVLPRAKRYLYDTGTHVPMIARVPQKWKHLIDDQAGTASDRPVSFIDLPPTVLSLAGVDVPDQMQGRAFLGEGRRDAEPYVFLFGQRFDARMLRFVRGVTDGRYRYIRNFHPHRHRGILAGYPHGQAGWRSFYALQQAGKTNEQQSAFWNRPQPVEELYDTQSDPWEVKNLAGDRQHGDLLAKMRHATLNKMSEIRDTGLVPEAMYNQLSREGTIFDYVHSESFPYDDVLARALAASAGGKEQLSSLTNALNSQHPVIRYWGALACTIAASRNESAAEQVAVLRRLTNDEIPAVQIAAAEALVANGDTESGSAALQQILSETNDDMVALEALNVVASLGITKQIPRDVYKRACETGSYPGRMKADYPSQ